MVLPNTALHLKALLDFEDKDGDKVVAGDEWLFEGPGKLTLHWERSDSLVGVCLPTIAPTSSYPQLLLHLPLPRHIHPPEGGGGRGDHSGYDHQTESGAAAEGPQGVLGPGWQGEGDRWGPQGTLMAGGRRGVACRGSRESHL